MIRTLIAAPFALFASQAFAHSGHIAAEGGHTHFIAIGAAVVALAIVVGAIIRVKRSNNV